MQTSAGASNDHALNHQFASQPSDQAMTISNRSPIHPISSCRPSYSTAGSETATHSLVAGEGLMRKPSNSSSICRSPSWEDSRRRKREKQEAKDKGRRKEEKEAMENKEIRHPNRLTKAPPESKGVSKRPASMVRSDSAPVLHALSTPAAFKIHYSSLTPGQSSNDAESRTFMPGKSTDNSPTEGPGISSMQGFIGGLKLHQANEAVAQQISLKQMTPAVKLNLVEEIEAFDTNVTISSGNLREGGLDLKEPEDEAADGAPSSLAKLRKPESSTQAWDLALPIMEGKYITGPEATSSGSESIFQKPNLSNSFRTKVEDSWGTCCSKKGVKEAICRSSLKTTTISPCSRPPISYREPAQLAETVRGSRRGSFSSIFSKPQPSKDVCSNSYQEECCMSSTISNTSTKPHTRGRSGSFTKSSLFSLSRSTTTGSFKAKVSQSEKSDQTPLDRTGQPSQPGTVGKSGESRGLELSRPGHLQNIKVVAKAAFSRKSYIHTPSTKMVDEFLSTKKVRPASVRTVSRDEIVHLASQSTPQRDLRVSQEAFASKSHNTSDERSRTSLRSSLKSNSSDEYHSLFNEKILLNRGPCDPQPEQVTFPAVDDANTTAHSRIDLGVSDQMLGTALPRNRKLETQSSSGSPTFTPSASIYSQDLSFLPPLRHRTLRRPSKVKLRGSSLANHAKTSRQPSQSTLGVPQLPTPPMSSSSSFVSSPTPFSAANARTARHHHTQHHSLPSSASTAGFSAATADNQEANARAKMFVVCCGCRYFHDMPSKVYEYMAKPDGVVKDSDLGVSGVISMRVKCPWCAHGMSTTCCEGWAAVVMMQERLH